MFGNTSDFSQKLNNFYMGRIYPIIICALVLVGYLFGLEPILIPVIVLLAAFSFWVCRSIRPLLVPLCTFLYSLSNENSVFGEVSSDYYLTGWRVKALAVLSVIVAISLVAFLVRTRIISKIRLRKTPLLLPLLILSAAFMLNGVLSESWVSKNLVFGFLQVLSFLIIFVLFYHGFSDEEDARELADYLGYVTMLISFLLVIELISLYTSDAGVIENGEILKNKIVFGWGSCNNAGIYLTMTIPMCFYGAYRSKMPVIYFFAATAAYICSILTLSRNAFLWGSVVYALCLLGFSIFGKRRRFFAFCMLTVLLCGVVVMLVYRETILTALSNYSDQGFSDSGRFEIWRLAFESFLKNPIFGNGFHSGLSTGNLNAPFIPSMAHNTVFQLLSGLGIAGILSYGIYRIATLKYFFYRPELMKTMLGAAMLVLLCQSLLDNFIFQIQPMFYYSIAMAIVCRRFGEQKPWRSLIRSDKIKISKYLKR